MIAYIRGILAQASPIYVVVDVKGIGYKILIPTSVFGHLPQIGEEIFLHTSFVIREASQALYGFLTFEERDLFEALMGVSGIGPKLALSLIGHISTHDLHTAVSNHDLAAICKVPGVGKKTAERLIIEMRDKLTALLPQGLDNSARNATDQHPQKIQDAMSALINLGYNQVTAQKAIKKTINEHSEEIDLASLITHALNHV